MDFSDFSTDPNYELLERHLDKIDIAFFGLKSDQTDIIKKLSVVAKNNNKLFIITLGENGSIAFKGATKYSCDAKPIEKVIDTTGAGDAFAAGFLSDYVHQRSVQNALEKGSDVAAKTVEFLGSVPE